MVGLAAIALSAVLIASQVSALLMHFGGVFIAYKMSGIGAAFTTLLVPVISTIYWFFQVGQKFGFFHHWFTIAVLFQVVLMLFCVILAIAAR